MNDATARLDALLRDYGKEWQIERDRESNAWTAIRRPTPTALHVLVAHDLAALVAKIKAAQDER